MCSEASPRHRRRWSPVLENLPSAVQPHLPSKHRRVPASCPPRCRMSVVHLRGNDSCLSRPTCEASLAAVTSVPFPKLSFSGVSTTRCSKIRSDKNQAAPECYCRGSLCAPAPKAATRRLGFVSPNYLFVTRKPRVSSRYCGGIFGLMHRQKA